jgi:hypothetical protein
MTSGDGVMEKTLYLHIGHGKTGTTAIQNYLSAHSERILNDYGIFFPVKRHMVLNSDSSHPYPLCGGNRNNKGFTDRIQTLLHIASGIDYQALS